MDYVGFEHANDGDVAMFPAIRKALRTRTRAATLTSLAFVVAACTQPETRKPFTVQDLNTAQVSGFEEMRLFVDASVAEVEAARRMFVPQTNIRQPNYLLLSAGGEGGAYGAGFLSGWSARGDRPEFDLVTGVSAGALIAPFAFVGRSTDAELTAFFSDGLATRLDARNSFVTGALGQSIYPAGPLSDLIAFEITDALIDQVAARHKEGARLLVLTTNLDAGRGVIWDMGAIAAAQSSFRYDLFRQVLRASASIPAIFPPTPIAATSIANDITELHVDGGAVRQLLFMPDEAYSGPLGRSLLGSEQPNIFVVVNQQLMPSFAMSRDQTLAIGRRSYGILIRSSTRDSLTADREFAAQHGLNFQMTSITYDLSAIRSQPFDANYMKAALSLGFRNGNLANWVISPSSRQR